MPEEIVWRGSSSQWKNFGFFLLQVVVAVIIGAAFILVWGAASPEIKSVSPFILLLLAVPIFIALARYLKTKCKVYELTTERMKTTDGVFSKVTETLELYRVKDLETRQPFLYRLVGVENIHINTSDMTTPFVPVEAIPARIGFADKLRNQVEIIRQQKGVREIDIE